MSNSEKDSAILTIGINEAGGLLIKKNSRGLWRRAEIAEVDVFIGYGEEDVLTIHTITCQNGTTHLVVVLSRPNSEILVEKRDVKWREEETAINEMLQTIRNRSTGDL